MNICLVNIIRSLQNYVLEAHLKFLRFNIYILYICISLIGIHMHLFQQMYGTSTTYLACPRQIDE